MHYPALLRDPKNRSRLGAVALLFTLLLALGFAPASAFADRGETPAASPLASPDWRDITVYQVVTDRYFNGDPSNDNAVGTYDPADSRGVHGGDWQGLEERLDYIDGLGVNAIWISPVVENAAGEFHGYAARDLSTYAPQMGGLPALQSFVQAAHARGIYVIIDIVANHMGDLIDSADAGYPSYDPSGSYTLRWRNPSNRHEPPFDDLSWYHSYGQIDNFNDPEQVLGELFGLDDLDTTRQDVKDALFQAYADLITATDCDGFRVDTVKHADIPFWQDFVPRIRAHAAGLGKNDFLFLGEIFDGNPAKVGIYTGTMAGGPYILNTATWFPMMYASRWVFSGNGDPAALSSTLGDSNFYDPTVRDRLGLFYDNHDVGRLAAEGLASQDDDLLRQALTWILSWPGMPVVYYGTEQEYDGGGDPWNREDLWDGQWDFGPSEGDGFHQTSQLYRHIRAMQDLRAQLPALRRGPITVHRADSGSGPGLIIYTREDPAGPTGDVLIALNNSQDDLSESAITTRWAPGTKLRDPFVAARELEVDGGGQITLSVPARSELVLTAASPARALHVAATAPAHDDVVADAGARISVSFDRPMSPGASAFISVDPPLGLQINWRNHDTALIKPVGSWSNGTRYTLRVDAGTPAQDGSTLETAFAFDFEASFSTAGLSLPAGYRAEIIRPFGFLHPLGLELLPAEPLGPSPRVDRVLAGDVVRQRILQLVPSQQKVITHAGHSAWTPILALDRDRDGGFGEGLLVATPSQLYAVDSEGLATQLHDFGTGIEAPLVGTGAHAGRVYVSSPAVNDVFSYEGGGVTPLSIGLDDPRGMAQPAPNSGHPDAIYVCDPDLDNGYGQGSGAIYRFDAAGTLTLWTANALVEGANSLAFAPFGPFGLGNAYVVDALGERILRIDPAGSVSVFASGFENLFGSDAIAFGTDYDLYVLDPGGTEPITNTNGSSADARLIRIVADTPIGNEPSPRRTSFELEAVPNPFNPRTELRFELDTRTPVRLALYDAAGRLVRTLLDEERGPGAHRVSWEGRDEQGREMASGVYFARLFGAGDIAVQKLVLVR